jgi:transposase
MNKVKELNFDGRVIYCGLDTHKTNWKINARMEGIEMAAFSQNPDPLQLKRYFDKNFPGAELKVVYEAGFCGFEIQRSLANLGIDCVIVNPADVPSSDKDRKRKDDKRDARKLSLELAKGNLKGIYIPDKEMQDARTLVRQRFRLIKDQTRCANRIKHLLLCNGIQTGEKSELWSLRFIKKLQQLDCRSTLLNATLQFALDQYMQVRRIQKEVTFKIRELSKQEPFAKVQQILQSIDGIGLLSGMVIQTEIGDINRFKRLDSLCDYAGFVPNIYSSNDKTMVRGITKRGNNFLRQTVIESSWMLIRKDPAMLMKYNEYKHRMKGNKAIVRIAKHLLSRIRFLWKNEQNYVRGLLTGAEQTQCVLEA